MNWQKTMIDGCKVVTCGDYEILESHDDDSYQVAYLGQYLYGNIPTLAKAKKLVTFHKRYLA